MEQELWMEVEENDEECRSFDDSDRFEEDSLCSWVSEPESVCGNWRGWKRSSQNGVQNFEPGIEENGVESLLEICSRTVAKYIPFETVENTYPQIPEQLQVRITFWSFPPAEDDIRLYSCLANGSPDKFSEGELLLKIKAVKDVLQMGFHLSATVHQPHSLCQSKGTYNVAVMFDRRHITSCNCTCDQSATWCSHVIALCLFRIHYPNLVCLRAPVSEYLLRLKRNQLQKFAQYLITELPQQLLPTAQRLLDELLSSQESAINSVSGAPDPTAGPSAVDQAQWYLDEDSLHENIKKMLVRFCGPSPLVFSDVNALYLANTAPPTAAEWSNLLRPLRGREPEGMWNLLSIVRELFHRGDMNAVNLLVILTEECLANDMVLIWWFDSRSQASGKFPSHSHSHGYRGNTNAASTEATKHACAGFCDELVALWRLAVLNPQMAEEERQEIKLQLEVWHNKTVEKGRTGRGSAHVNLPTAVACFPGFLPAVEACSLNWKNVDLGVVSDAKFPMKITLTVPDSSKDAESGVDETSHEALPLVETKRLAESEEINSEQTVENLKERQPLQGLKEDLEVLCARTEALHVHGYSSVAAQLAIRLAESILSDSAKRSGSHTPGAKRSSSRNHATTSFTSTVLVKAAFLCNVLAEEPLCHHLAFRVGMLGLETPREPAKSKAVEVKLANQESELVSLLKKLPLGSAELAVVREKAERLRQGQLRRGESVLPIMLATFIFDVLCPSNVLSHAKRQVTTKFCETTQEDEELGFKAALYALGMKGNVLETQYPMLCEGTRRQRGDLALALLLHCRNDSSRIRQVMDVLLDKSRYDAPSNAGENQSKHKSGERNGGINETSTVDEVKTSGSFADPDRRESSQSLASTSDSGTDSSKDSSGTEKCKTRVRFSRPPASRLNATVSEVSVDDESGTSSGVDADLVPVSQDADAKEQSQIGAMAVQVSQGGIWQGSTNPTNLGDSASDAPHVLDPSSDVPRRAICVVHVDEPNRDVPYSKKPNKDGPCESGVDDGDDNSVGISRTGYTGGDVPEEAEPMQAVSPLTEPKKHTLCTPSRIGDAQGDAAASGVLEVGTNSGEVPFCGTVGQSPSQIVISDERALDVDFAPNDALVTKKVENRDRQRFSSEGDLSDIEADFEEVNRGALSNRDASARTLLFTGERPSPENAFPSTSTSTSTASEGPDPHDSKGSSSSGAQSSIGFISVQSPEGAKQAERKDACAAVAVALAEEALDEHARESASPRADDGDRNRRRSRHRGRRRRRGGKSALYQATEAEAHFMFELAKTVLSKAGGSSSTSVFCTQPASSDTQSGPHKVLLVCAFEIGLFALGLHNRTSPNWLSRTYSSHVSWITERAMDIGHQAIALLLERWEGNLTPSEVASIADRASNSNDRAIVRAAAELGLSCLHMAHTLNPAEIKRALSQCREEDLQLLDQACQAVESAARGGGVYPEVLFDVARQWYYLHEQSQASSSTSRTSVKSETRTRSFQSRSSQPSSSSQSPPLSPFASQVPQFNIPPNFPSMAPPLYATPEQYVHHQMHQHVQQMMGHYPSYLPGASSGHRPGVLGHYSYSFPRSFTGTQFSLSGAYAGLPPPPYQGNAVSANSGQHLSRVTTTQQGVHVSYFLNSAYRVGMLALEFLSRRTSDDRPSVKFSRNPTCSEDIRWLCNLSAKALGTSHLQRFCVAALNAVVSPFVLHDLALEAARHLARSNPAQLAANLRSPTISPLVQKSLTMYAQCIHYHLINISQAEYDEFVELLRHARGAFCMAPGGMTQFNELLQSIRWGYAKKKELWQMIMTGLSKA